MNILLIGQGFSGSLLAWSLIKKGLQVTMVDSCPEFTSTKVAAGIMLPVTGRRLAKTYLADVVLPFAFNTYREIESVTKGDFFVEKEVLQVFSSVANMNEWYARTSENDMNGYWSRILNKEEAPDTVSNDHGGILLKQCGMVDPLPFIRSMQEYISKTGEYVVTEFNQDELLLNGGNPSWKGNEYSHVIFCEGYRATGNPLFSYLPFKPAKGEILDFTAPRLNDDYIISSGIYILPLGNGRFRAGATYVWDDLTENITDSALKLLSGNLDKAITCEFRITGQKAGIRPAMRDRRPVIGFHPMHDRIGIFNGLGTKGTMLGPYYANQMAELIVEGKQPDSDVTVRRFDSLCQVL